MSQLRVRKRFGQHFLVDDFVIDDIIALIAPREDEHLVEIGPGCGALTALLHNRVARLSVIEIDRDLAASINERYGKQANFDLLLGDALKVDYGALQSKQKLRVVGNLPYNISTPLILKLIEFSVNIEDMTFMLQKEVVDRLVATPNSKDYGRLSIMVQSQADVSSYFEVGPTAFDPPPKVTSKLVRIAPQGRRLTPAGLQHLAQCTRIAFGQRRKTLRNTLGKKFSHDLLEDCGIDMARRAEEISVDTFCTLAQTLSDS